MGIRISALLLTLIFCYAPSYASEIAVSKAVLFENKNKTDKPDFYFEKKDSKLADGSTVQETKFTYPDGRVALAEKLVFDSTGKISTYFYDQKQVSQRIWLTIEGNVMKMKKEWYDGDKVTKTDEEIDEYKERMHLGPELQNVALKNWSTLTAGESYKFKLIIMERLDTFSFELEYDGIKDHGGKKVHQFSLYPRSFIIRLLVTRIRFYFDNTPDRKFLEVDGTLPVKPWNGKVWDGIFDGRMTAIY